MANNKEKLEISNEFESSLMKNSVPIDFTEAAFSAKLLGRDIAPVYSFAAKELIRDKVIMVTGAGGSIGSEIVRQLIGLGARMVYLLDNDEFSLYKMSLELNGNALLTDERFILADVKERTVISGIVGRILPDIIFHAAAHKYVPLLEQSPEAGLTTNVLGTDNIASICAEYGVKHFVNISTDKAARPVSILGLTKRLAELCTAGYKNGNTIVCSVRFGNVLWSRGSMMPTFVWQIANNRPVTVTHPEVSRYFMSIPEAAGLVIEGAALASGGETYILDMGEPIRILDLIDRYVHFTRCVMPEIVYTGLRPGEKLIEELVDPSEICMPTVNKRITQVCVDHAGAIMPWDKDLICDMIGANTMPDRLKRCLCILLRMIESRNAVNYEKNMPIYMKDAVSELV